MHIIKKSNIHINYEQKLGSQITVIDILNSDTLQLRLLQQLRDDLLNFVLQQNGETPCFLVEVGNHLNNTLPTTVD